MTTLQKLEQAAEEADFNLCESLIALQSAEITHEAMDAAFRDRLREYSIARVAYLKAKLDEQRAEGQQ